GGVERACGLPPIALRSQHGAVRDAPPCAEGPCMPLSCDQEGAEYKRQSDAMPERKGLTALQSSTRSSRGPHPLVPLSLSEVLTPCPPLPAGEGGRRTAFWSSARIIRRWRLPRGHNARHGEMAFVAPLPVGG